MGKFVSRERVAVQIDGDPNTIYIKPKMDFGTRNRVNGTATRLTQKQGETQSSAEFDMGAYNIALIIHNVVGWAGPDFENRQCVESAMMELDPDDALLEEVLKQISERNTKKEDATDPNLSTSASSSGSTSTPAKKG